MNVQAALDTLELREMKNPDEIHCAYRRLVKRWHPDLFAHQPDIHSLAEEKLKLINRAYSVLKDYFRDTNIYNCTYNDNTSSNSPKNNQTNPTESGGCNWWTGWFDAVFRRNSYNPTESQNTDMGRNRSKSAPGVNRSGFDTVLRNACINRNPQSGDAFSPAPRTRPVFQYRRRAKSTRIDGFQPASPVSPIRPVSRIDPIEGSD